jgi:hypothetical protein
VRVGDNGLNGVAGFSAGPGFDLATGLGTPDAEQLAQAVSPCAGDCDKDGFVTVDDLLVALQIALGGASVAQCMRVDSNGDGQVTIDELLASTRRALDGC